MPASSRFFSASSDTFGMSRVISSGPKLGVARHHLEFFDVDRGEHVVFHDALGHQDGILEVVAVPRHERDEHVLAERQITQVGGRTVGDDFALLAPVTNIHKRTLVDAGVLVRALELAQR
jgi:hypothetical protein